MEVMEVMEVVGEMEVTDLTVPVQQVWVTAWVFEEELHYARVSPPAGSHESRGPTRGVLDIDLNVPVSQQTLHYEDVALLGRDVQRSPPVFPLDVDLDILPLEELSDHHALGFVGGHTQRGLAVLIELVGVLTNRLQLVDHVGVPGERGGGVISQDWRDKRRETHHLASSFSLRIVCMGGWNTTLKFLGLGGSEGPKPQSPKQPTTLLISTEGRGQTRQLHTGLTEISVVAGREEVAAESLEWSGVEWSGVESGDCSSPAQSNTRKARKAQSGLSLSRPLEVYNAHISLSPLYKYWYLMSRY